MTALIVCMRFSASSKTIDAGDSKTSSVTSSAVHAELLVDLLADLRVRVVERRQAVHELDVGVAGERHRLRVDLVGHEQLDALGPDLVGLAHRDPDVGEQDVAAPHGLGDVLGDRDRARRGSAASSSRRVDELVAPATATCGAAIRTSMPSFAPPTR